MTHPLDPTMNHLAIRLDHCIGWPDDAALLRVSYSDAPDTLHELTVGQARRAVEWWTREGRSTAERYPALAEELEGCLRDLSLLRIAMRAAERTLAEAGIKTAGDGYHVDPTRLEGDIGVLVKQLAAATRRAEAAEKEQERLHSILDEEDCLTAKETREQLAAVTAERDALDFERDDWHDAHDAKDAMLTNFKRRACRLAWDMQGRDLGGGTSIGNAIEALPMTWDLTVEQAAALRRELPGGGASEQPSGVPVETIARELESLAAEAERRHASGITGDSEYSRGAKNAYEAAARLVRGAVATQAMPGVPVDVCRPIAEFLNNLFDVSDEKSGLSVFQYTGDNDDPMSAWRDFIAAYETASQSAPSESDCLEAHRAGRSRPLRDLIDELKDGAAPDEPPRIPRQPTRPSEQPSGSDRILFTDKEVAAIGLELESIPPKPTTPDQLRAELLSCKRKLLLQKRLATDLQVERDQWQTTCHEWQVKYETSYNDGQDAAYANINWLLDSCRAPDKSGNRIATSRVAWLAAERDQWIAKAAELRDACDREVQAGRVLQAEVDRLRAEFTKLTASHSESLASAFARGRRLEATTTLMDAEAELARIRGALEGIESKAPREWLARHEWSADGAGSANFSKGTYRSLWWPDAIAAEVAEIVKGEVR